MVQERTGSSDDVFPKLLTLRLLCFLSVPATQETIQHRFGSQMVRNNYNKISFLSGRTQQTTLTCCYHKLCSLQKSRLSGEPSNFLLIRQDLSNKTACCGLIITFSECFFFRLCLQCNQICYAVLCLFSYVAASRNSTHTG